MRISVNEVTTWLQCRKKWDYRYRRGIEGTGSNALMASGKAVHETVEAMLKGEARSVEEVAAKAEAVLQREFVGKEDQHDLVAKFLPGALRAISRFPQDLFSTPGWEIEKEVSATYPIATPEEVTVFGFPDFVLYKPDEIVIYELKSTSSSDKRPQDYFLWNPQHRLYATLITDRDPNDGRPVFVEYILVQTGKSDGGNASLRWLMKKRVIDDTRRDMLAALEEMETAKIIPAYDYLCRGCDYAKLCEARITGADEESVIQESFVLRERRQ